MRPVLAAVMMMLAADAAADTSAKQRAAKMAAESAQHYKRGEFEISIALLRRAYALHPEPNLLYNLARSLEGVGDKAGAVEAYKQYLASKAAIPDRGAIERRVATLEAELAPPPVTEVTPPPPPAPVIVTPPPDPVVITQPAPAADDRSYLPWVPITLGVGMLGGGAWFGYRARTNHDAAVGESSAVTAQQLQDDARSQALLANVLFVAGGAALIGGAIWEWRERGARGRSSPMSARASIAPGGVVVRWSFP